MKKNSIKYSLVAVTMIILSLGLLISCEIDEPFPEPTGSFVIKGVNPATGFTETLEEPYTLSVGESYEFIVDGEAEQFVFWFGVAGDSTKSTPSGSDFLDRDVNHYSKGVATVNGLTRYSYKAAGDYTITLVASSYSYVEQLYKETIIQKDVEVVAAK